MQGAAAPNPSTSIDLDLETLIGTATAPGTLIADPFDARRYVHGAGATVVLSSFARPRPQLLLDGCAEPVSAIAQSRSGVHLAAGEEGHDADITVWSANSVTGAWSKLYKFEEHDNSVHSLSFSHDERLLASVGGDNRIIVWDMATGMIVSQVDVSSEGGKASAATKGAARQGSMQQPGAQAGCCIEAVLFGGLTQDVSGAFTSSYMLASAGRNGHLKVWSLNPFTGELTGTAIKLGAATRNFACLAFSEDGDRLFAGTRSGDVYLVNTRSAKLANIVPVRRAGVTSICVGYRGVRAAPFGSSARSNGEFICVGGDDGAFSCWAHKRDAFGRAEPAFVQTMNVPPSDALVGAITSLSFLGWGCEGGRDDPTKILVGSSRGYVKVISLESDGAGVDGDEAEKEAARAYAALLGAPDDGSRSGGPNDDRVTFISESHCGPVASCAMMGGEHFVTAACDSSLRLWSMNDFSVPVKVQVHDCGVPTGGIAATADKVFSGWSDGRIRAHLTGTDPAAAAGVVAGSGNPAETGEAPLLWAIDEAHKEGVGAICLSHNERFLLSGGAQGEVRMWEMGSRSMVSHLKEHRTRVTGECPRFSRVRRARSFPFPPFHRPHSAPRTTNSPAPPSTSPPLRSTQDYACMTRTSMR